MLRHFVESLTYPFKDSDWLVKLWALPIAAYIPIVNLLLFEGWRMHVIRHLSEGREGLPALDVQMLKDGGILWLCWLPYMLVPALVCNVLGFGGPLGLVSDAWLLATGSGRDIATDFVGDAAASVVIYAVWALIGFATFQAGMVRYALTGRVQTLLNVPVNLMFLLRHSVSFLMFWVFSLAVAVMIWFADFVLTVTFVGAILLPLVTFCTYYVMTAHELGTLAHRVRRRTAPAVPTVLDQQAEPAVASQS